MTVTHKDLGHGEVTKVDTKKERITVDFGWQGIKEYTVMMFDIGVITTNDTALQKALNRIRRKIAKRNVNVPRSYGMDSFFEGGVAEDISCSKAELFEAIGYIAKNSRYIEAEVSQSRQEVFEEMFGEYNATISYVHHDAENNRNQFRIDFDRTVNIPRVLEDNLLDVGNGRIAKSLFVERLVKEFGFVFGAVQNLAKIRAIAERYGYLKEFEKGFNL